MLSLLAEVRRRAGDAGLNLLGLVDAERFDAAQTLERRVRSIAPDCGTVLVVGSGGRELWQRFERRSGASCRSAARVDRYASAAARQIETLLRSSAIRCRTIAGPCDSRLPFTQLGEAAGLGTVSPVTGLLLHPQFGPWVRIRAVVLADGRPFGPIADASISERFQPCCGCSRPCVTACPVGVHDGASAARTSVAARATGTRATAKRTAAVAAPAPWAAATATPTANMRTAMRIR